MRMTFFDSDCSGHRMLICVLKHTPGISHLKSTASESLHYAGLEIEVSLH